MDKPNVIYATYEPLSGEGLQCIFSNHSSLGKLEICNSFLEIQNKMTDPNHNFLIIDFDSSVAFTKKEVQLLQSKFPEASFLLISTESNKDVLELIDTGINGCITKKSSKNEIIQSVLALVNGRKFFCPRIIDLVLQKHLYKEKNILQNTGNLTSREAQVTGLIASGLTNKRIALHLNLSEHTVHTHRKKVMKKLNIRSISQLTIYAINTGLFTPQTMA